MNTKESVRRRSVNKVAGALVFVLIAACSHSSDEEQIRAVIDAGEKAVEARDTSDTMALVADDYRDAQGLDKPQLQNFIRGYLFTHPKIELLVRIADIKIETPTTARARIEVTMVGTRLSGQQSDSDRTSLTGEAESLRVEFKRIDDEWRVIRVDRRYD